MELFVGIVFGIGLMTVATWLGGILGEAVIRFEAWRTRRHLLKMEKAHASGVALAQELIEKINTENEKKLHQAKNNIY